MTAHKLALIKTTKMIVSGFGLGIIVAVLLNYVPFDYLLIAVASVMTIFMAKMLYNMNLSQAKEELQERNIDKPSR
jgi:hypothetical protein